MRKSSLPLPLHLTVLLCAATVAPPGAAQGVAAGTVGNAGSSPWYVGVAQTFSHESNLLRLREGQALPPGSSESDTVSSTALVAGIDQRFGRQRLTGTGSLRANRYDNNEAFNSEGYGLALALDWETLYTLSGRLSAGADRQQRPDVRGRAGEVLVGGNTERSQRAGATARVGLAGPLGLEVGVQSSRVDYGNPAADYAEYRQRGASAGVRYRLGGASSVALSARQTRYDYPNLLFTLPDPNDRRERNEVDLSAAWRPGGSSSFDVRIGRGKTTHEQLSERDFSSTTGALVWTWEPGGRLRMNTRLARDTGQSSDVATTAFSQTTDLLRVGAEYALTGKTSLSAALQTYRRQLAGNGQFVTGLSGRDNGNSASLGVRWEALRSLTLSCLLSHDRRGSNTNPLLNDAYSANVYSCSGQFVLQ